MDVATFRASFPEFRTASDPLIGLRIAEATRRVAPETFGDLTEDAIGYLAAHLLATSPMGISQRLDDDKTESTYLKEYLAIRKAKVPRFIVT